MREVPHKASLRAATFAAVTLLATSAAADSSTPTRVPAADGPCSGCRAAFTTPEPSMSPVPLIVVLHGDWGIGPSDLLAAWEKHAAKRGMAVLALKCPTELGCKGSWWRWNGDPSWVTKQIDLFEKAKSVRVDRKRLYLVGWSGGASYIGMRSTTFQQLFAAIVYHGGGVASGSVCALASSSPAPAYFLVGDANPLHSLAVDLKKENEQCGVDVTWKVIKGADHAAEWKALDASGGVVADWLLTKTRR